MTKKNMKGMETLVSLSLVFLISIVAIAVVVSIGMPVINSASESTEIQNAQNDMKFVDDYVRTVAAEGYGATRVYVFSSPKSFETVPGDDAIQFSKAVSTGFVQYLSRTITGNLVTLSGNDVNCGESGGYLMLENGLMSAYFRKINGTIDTSDIIYKLIQKSTNTTIYVGNSSVVIDNISSTTTGTGYTEISSPDSRQPACQVHAAVNSTLDYDIYYKLYAGADFLVVDVRNIR